MDQAETTPPEEHQTSTTPLLPEKPKEQFVRKYKWPLIVVIILAIGLIGAGTYVVFSRRTKTPNNSATTTQPTTQETQSAPENTNSWQASVDPKSLPLGDNNLSTEPQQGKVYSCSSNFRTGGAQHAGDWINQTAKTWNSDAKVAVNGRIDWPTAQYSSNLSANSRVITTNDLPLNFPTGIFPIAGNDPAHQYDTNPNQITGQSITLTLPANPVAAASPSCVDLGYIGVATNGVLLFNALDAAGRDAVAHETQDLCGGHPDGQSRYHYHNVSSCIKDESTGSSTLVGYALDGYGIFVERDASGNLPTNADLDACHGRTSQIMWDGKLTEMYHYSATLEYPYTVGCFHGTPIVTQMRP